MGKPYAVETCAGWRHVPFEMDALGEARCSDCGWCRRSHKQYGRPHPSERPPDYDIDDPEIISMWQIDDDDDEASQQQPGDATP